MPRVVSCSACRQSLTLPDQVAGGQQVRCPACKFTMVVPGAPSSKPGSGVAESTIAVKSVKTDAMAKPVGMPKPASRPSNPPVQLAVMAAPPPTKASKPASTPSKPEVVDDEAPVTPVKKKKKKKKEADNKRVLYFGIGGMLLFVVCLITALVVFIPWGKMFSSTPEAQIVDAFTAINSMGYNNAALRVLNSDTAALCIPGPRQVVVTRPNPQGKYLLLRLKVPYSDIDRHFQGVRQRISLTQGHIQIEANGVTKDAMFIQDDLAETGNFQMSYQPPMQDAKVDLRDYLGPNKANKSGARAWSSEGSLKEYASDMTFETNGGLQVRISSGSQRQDGGGGNIFEHFTGKKILGNKEAFTGPVEGFIFVDWNLGSAGFVVHSELEQPNEIGLNWNVNALVELPEGGVQGDVFLKAVGVRRKLRLK
jgi:LSD1 subclass zinc finger protein